jgi:hypothetical protein
MTGPAGSPAVSPGLVDDAVWNLCLMGHLDLEEDDEGGDWEERVRWELGMLAGHCFWCRSPDRLAWHWLSLKQQEWERSVPVWECDCGATYKVLPEWRTEVFCVTGEDGLLGDRAGEVRRDGKGRVKHSDKCRGCGEEFAAVIARQLSPQQALF